MNYQEYLNSTLWQVIRRDALWGAGNKCSLCRFKEELEVHHLTYKNLGNERREDLQVLCARCHNDIHYSKNKNFVPKLSQLMAIKIIKEADYIEHKEKLFNVNGSDGKRIRAVLKKLANSQ